jgi:hypothetical protein
MRINRQDAKIAKKKRVKCSQESMRNKHFETLLAILASWRLAFLIMS